MSLRRRCTALAGEDPAGARPPARRRGRRGAEPEHARIVPEAPERAARRARRGRAAARSRRCCAVGVRRRLRGLARSRTRPSSSASRSGSRFACARGGARRGRAAARRDRGARARLPARRARARPSGELEQLLAESGERFTRRRLLVATGALAGARARGRAARARSSRSARSSTSRAFVATPWFRGRRLVGEDGAPLRADEIQEADFYTAYPEGADREQLAAPLVVVRLPPSRDPPARRPRRLGARRHPRLLEDLHPRRLRDLALPHADLRRARAAARRSSAPATTRPSTPRPAAPCSSGPAGRPLPQLPLEIDPERRPARPPAPSAARSARPGGASARGGRRDQGRRPLARPPHRRRAPLLRAALRYVFPDNWSFLLGEVALYAFIVLVATGHLPRLLLPGLDRDRPSTTAPTGRSTASR